MSDGTGISWTDATWPVVTGCTHISEGCDNCYAANSHQAGSPPWRDANGRFNGQVRPRPASALAEAPQGFVSDMPTCSPGRSRQLHRQVWDVMARTRQHTYQVLTRSRLRSLLRGWERVADRDPLPNVWCGVSPRTRSGQTSASRRYWQPGPRFQP